MEPSNDHDCGKYRFSLQKYKTQNEKEKAKTKIELLFQTEQLPSYVLKNNLTLQEKSFFWQHLTKYQQNVAVQSEEQYPVFYKHIPKITFEHTTSINLAYCNILNIEIFAYLQCPTLHTLELFQNHIMTIKPLAKNHDIKKMLNLTLYRNCIIDIHTLYRVRADQMTYFELDIKKEDEVVCEDTAVFYKVPAASAGDMESNTLPDEYNFQRYCFSLKKYKTDQEKQQIINRLNSLCESKDDRLDLINIKIQLEDKAFLYEHLTKYRYELTLKDEVTYAILQKYIPNILFEKTKCINLAQCNIMNIEVFGYLQCPNLQTLQLFNNHIMTIKPLAKNSDLKQMINLTLYRNCITDFHTFYRTRADKQGYFELDINKQDKVVCQDISVFYKVQMTMKSSYLKFWASSESRIRNHCEKWMERFKRC